MKPADLNTATLFPITEQLSTRLAWLRKYDVQTYKSPCMDDDEEPWSAWRKCHEHNGMPEGEHVCGFGATEADAITTMAKILGLKLWNEEKP